MMMYSLSSFICAVPFIFRVLFPVFAQIYNLFFSISSGKKPLATVLFAQNRGKSANSKTKTNTSLCFAAKTCHANKRMPKSCRKRDFGDHAMLDRAYFSSLMWYMPPAIEFSCATNFMLWVLFFALSKIFLGMS